MKDMKSSRNRTILARTTWTNSGEGKPDLVVHQDQQFKITLRILKARLFAQLSRFTNLFAQYFNISTKQNSMKTSLHQELEKLSHLAFLAPVEE